MKSLSCRSTATSMIKKNCLALLVGVALSSSVHAQQASTKTLYAISSGELVQVINEISRKSGLQIVYDIDALRGIKAADIKGKMTIQQALDKALIGTELSWAQVNSTTIAIKKKNVAPKRPSEDDASEKPTEPKSTSMDSGSEVHEMEKMVVVGSRLGMSPVESALPVRMISREEIDRTGAGSIAQVLTYLSEVSVNNLGDADVSGGLTDSESSTNSSRVQLRGLPLGTTLVLINGRRAGDSSASMASGQFDLSTIPLAMVERIEVLPSGASAVYGGDGLAGVVNVVLRQGATGYELRVRTTGADGYGENLISFVGGKSWDRSEMTFSASWSERSALTANERELTADRDYSRFGGRDTRVLTSDPATIYSLTGCAPRPALCRINYLNRGNLPGLSSPFAVVPSGQDGTNLVPTDFEETVGMVGRSSPDRNIFSAEKSLAFGINTRIGISENLDIISELNYSKRDIPSREIPLSINGRSGTLGGVIGSNHPYNPFGVDVGYNYRFDRTGIYRDYSQEYWRVLFGMVGKFGEYDWEVTSFRSNDSTKSPYKAFDMNAVQRALDATDPNLLLNPFVADGSAPASRETFLSMLTSSDNEMFSSQNGANAFIKGPIVKMPAGSAIGLVGVEYLRSSQEYGVTVGTTVPQFADDTASKAAFAEIRVPILSSANNATNEKLLMSGAFRAEQSDLYAGTAVTETIGIEFRPLPKLMLRATHSTAFKPMVAFDANLPEVIANGFVFDPANNGEPFEFETLYAGGVPENLKPEESTSRMLGFVYSPSQKWRVSAGYWNIKLKERIAAVSTQYLVDNEIFYPSRIIRDPVSGFIERVDARRINISETNISGVDINVSGRFYVGGIDFDTSLSATYTYEYNEQVRPDAEVVSNLSVLRSTGWAPRWKIVPRLGASINDWIYSSIGARYVSNYIDQTPLYSGVNAGQQLVLGDIWFVDLNANFDIGRRFFNETPFLQGSSVSIGVNNMFDRLPDFCNSCDFMGYDASQYDIVGRTAHLEFKFSF